MVGKLGMRAAVLVSAAGPELLQLSGVNVANENFCPDTHQTEEKADSDAHPCSGLTSTRTSRKLSIFDRFFL